MTSTQKAIKKTLRRLRINYPNIKITLDKPFIQKPSIRFNKIWYKGVRVTVLYCEKGFKEIYIGDTEREVILEMVEDLLPENFVSHIRSML